MIGLFLSTGEAHDLLSADHLPPTMKAAVLLADRAYDAHERVIDVLQASGKAAVIPSKANRKVDLGYDQEICKARHLIENFSADLERFKVITTRYDKTARNFLAAAQLVAPAIWLK